MLLRKGKSSNASWAEVHIPGLLQKTCFSQVVFLWKQQQSFKYSASSEPMDSVVIHRALDKLRKRVLHPLSGIKV